MAKPKAAKTDPIKVTVLQPYLLTSMLAIGPNQRIFFSYTSVIKKKLTHFEQNFQNTLELQA